MPDYYEILQVHPKAEPEVIKAAYRKLAQKYHPDGNKPDGARMRLINEAYSVLSDSLQRQRYDAQRDKTTRSPRQSQTNSENPAPRKTQPTRPLRKTSNELKAEEYVQRAIEKELASDYPAAVKFCTEAIRLDPRNVNAYRCRGEARWFQSDYLGTIKDCDEAIRLDPRLSDAYVTRSWAKQSRGDLAGASKDHNEALRLDPRKKSFYERNPPNFEIESDYHAKQEKVIAKLEKVIRECSKAIRLNPHDASAYSQRGVARKDRGDFDGAAEDCAEAIKLNPQEALAYYGRGDMLQKQGYNVEAIRELDEAIRLDPNHAEAYISRASAHDSVGQPQKEIEDLETYLRLSGGRDPDTEAGIRDWADLVKWNMDHRNR